MQDAPVMKDVWLIRMLADGHVELQPQLTHPTKWQGFSIVLTLWYTDTRKRPESVTTNNALLWGMASPCQPQALCQHDYSDVGWHPGSFWQLRASFLSGDGKIRTLMGWILLFNLTLAAWQTKKIEFSFWIILAALELKGQSQKSY